MENSASWLAAPGGGVMECARIGVVELWSVGLEEMRSAEWGAQSEHDAETRRGKTGCLGG